jgi:hypothetical protein
LTEPERRGGRAEPSWIEGVHEGYPQLRRMGATLRERGVAFTDLSGAFRDHPERLYVDACHFGHAGNMILADRLAQAFLAELGPTLPARAERR